MCMYVGLVHVSFFYAPRWQSYVLRPMKRAVLDDYELHEIQNSSDELTMIVLPWSGYAKSTLSTTVALW
jgi:hypothetical protein